MGAREELAAIRERVEAATEGPWENEGGGEIGQHYTCLPPYQTVIGTEVSCSSYCYGGSTKGVERDADAEFIAHARTDVPRLVEALEAVVDLRDRLAAAPWDAVTRDSMERSLDAALSALTTDTKGDARD